MEDNHHVRASQSPVSHFLGALLILALGTLLFISYMPPAAHASPALLELAATTPDAHIAVIVQQTRDVDLTGWVTRSGGTITRNLSIINAFAAEMPAKTVAELARIPGVRWVSLDAQVEKSGCTKCPAEYEDTPNSYLAAIGALDLQQEAPSLNGQGITVAVVDSGIDNDQDLANGNNHGTRVLARAKVHDSSKGWFDHYGHGTFVAGVIGGNGNQSDGFYQGVAPQVNLVSVQVTDDKGMGMTSDIVAGLQWVLENKDRFNIRVVNLSMNSSVAESYDVDPLDAAVEILWFNKIVVVVSAGNTGEGGELYPPANDPFVITVGAVNDKGTPKIDDDELASYSGYTTSARYSKPDIVAPGNNIVSLLASEGSTLARSHRDHVVDDSYFRMSGTSVSSAVVSGAVALLLQSNPDLNPDQVKYRLMSTAEPFGPGSGAGYLNIQRAVDSTALNTANTGTPASQLLWTGPNPPAWDSVSWTSVSWTSVSWTSVSWTSVSWTSVSWTSVSWTSDYWGE